MEFCNFDVEFGNILNFAKLDFQIIQVGKVL